MKHQIEQLFIQASYNDESPGSFASKIMELFGKDDSRQTRSSDQNKARWKYLSMIANILNDRGHTYEAVGVEIPIKWNKDILYHIYWQSSRSVLFPEKKRQLNTREFSQLVDHVMDLFAMIFDIHIPFPSIKNQFPPKEPVT